MEEVAYTLIPIWLHGGCTKTHV